MTIELYYHICPRKEVLLQAVNYTYTNIVI